MENYQNKVDELQQEIEILEEKMVSPHQAPSCTSNKKAVIMFISAIAVPFVLYAFIYATGFGWVLTDGERDRKKVLKWTILITIIIWIVMALCYYFFLRC